MSVKQTVQTVGALAAGRQNGWHLDVRESDDPYLPEWVFVDATTVVDGRSFKRRIRIHPGMPDPAVERWIDIVCSGVSV